MKSSLLFQIILVTSLLAVTIPGHLGSISPAARAHPDVKTSAPASPSTPNVGIWNDACFASNMTVANPQCAIAGASLGEGSTVTVDVNVTNAPSFNGYEFSLFYDPTNLTLSKVDLSTGTVFDSPLAVANLSQAGGPFVPGVIRMSVVNLNGPFNGGSGVLAFFTFNIKGVGASPFTLAAGTSSPAEGGGATEFDWTRLVFGATPIDVSTSDGYFQNIRDNPARLGTVARFTSSPALPQKGQTIFFDASSSFDADNPLPTAIISYVWDFGDGVIAASQSPVQSHAFIPLGNSVTGNFSVLLRVYDQDNNFTGMVTHLVDIMPAAVHDVSVAVTVDPSQVQPGGNITVTVTVTNLGTFVETYNLSITYGVPTVTLKNYTNLMISSQGIQVFTNTLHTKGLSPGVYEVDAMVTDRLDTNLSNNSARTLFTIAMSAADFALRANPGFLSIPASSSMPVFSTITVTSLNGFAGPVSLTVSAFVGIPPGITPSQVTLTANSSANATLSVFVPNLTPGTSFFVSIMGTSGSLRHSVSIFVQMLAPPPDFQLLLSFSNGNAVIAGTSASIGVQLISFNGFMGNVTLSGALTPLVSQGPTLSFNPSQISLVFPGTPFSTLTVSTTTATPQGNYTVTIIGTSGALAHATSFRLTVLPPPVLRLTPSSGSLGTLVTVHGSGFFTPTPGPFFSPVELQMTFDDQLIGLVFLQGTSFNFTFDVPHAQVGILHQVHAKELFPSNLDVQASFLVTPEPAALGLIVSVGSIYFPGDTATIFVMTSLNGQPATVTNLQIVLVRPIGSNITLNAVSIATGVYRASYAVPGSASLGTYALVVKAQLVGSGNESTLGSFEVKPTWLQANGRNLLTGTSIAGAVGMLGLLAVAWKRGYFVRGKE